MRAVGMLGNVWEWVSGRAEGDGRKPSRGGAKERADLAGQVPPLSLDILFALGYWHVD